jgi:hypothetical protein
MQIDNYQEAQALTARLEATIPFQVRAGKELLKTMRDRGDSMDANTWLIVDWVKYSGDIGGINCGLEVLPGQTEQRYVVSLTHLEIDPEHPLASEVKAYQRKRIQRLMLQDQGGFAAELLSGRRNIKKKKPKKGFGQL